MTPTKQQALEASTAVVRKFLTERAKMLGIDREDIHRLSTGHEEREAWLRESDLWQLVGFVEATGWQPISTAPKDSSRVLLFREGFAESMTVGHWDSSFDEWHSANGFSFPGATHWMPTPAAPSTEEAQ